MEKFDIRVTSLLKGFLHSSAVQKIQERISLQINSSIWFKILNAEIGNSQTKVVTCPQALKGQHMVSRGASRKPGDDSTYVTADDRRIKCQVTCYQTFVHFSNPDKENKSLYLGKVAQSSRERHCSVFRGIEHNLLRSSPKQSGHRCRTLLNPIGFSRP